MKKLFFFREVIVVAVTLVLGWYFLEAIKSFSITFSWANFIALFSFTLTPIKVYITIAAQVTVLLFIYRLGVLSGRRIKKTKVVQPIKELQELKEEVEFKF